jgi:hypothetical protein
MSQIVLNRVESDSSIEISRNSKGYTWSIKAYGSTEVEIQTKLKNLLKTAKEVIKELENAS